VCRLLAATHSQLRIGHDDTVSVDGLVDRVVEQATGLPATDSESVAVDRYHLRLPMLSTQGVIEFDSRTETVRYRDTGGPGIVVDTPYRRLPES
jgi:hypothetical protein